jgi:hypothetical protein
VLRGKECAPTLSPSAVFTSGLVVESIKELEGASFHIGHYKFSILFINFQSNVPSPKYGNWKGNIFKNHFKKGVEMNFI